MTASRVRLSGSVESLRGCAATASTPTIPKTADTTNTTSAPSSQPATTSLG
jgi:hypothetical protein